MTQALLPLIGKICHVYMDDIIIWSNIVEEHEENIQKVLEALQVAHLYCSPKKTDLFALEITFLGHIISTKGIYADPDKIQCILEWPVPTSTTEVHGFLGLVRYLALFIPHLATHTAILDNLIKKEFDKTFPQWTSDYQKAFNAIKEIVTGTGCLTMIDYDSEENIYMTMDASLIGTDAVLSAGYTWENSRLVAFDSTKYFKAEQHYPMHEQEMLIIVHALKKWHFYLLGVYFMVYTDYCILEYFNKQKELSHY